MKRNEAILRELNLHPLWVRREGAVPDSSNIAPEAVAQSVRSESKDSVAALTAHESLEAFVPSQSPVAIPPVVSLDWPMLQARVKDCTACKLRAGCTQTVFGVGDEKAEWLFVGEGPGADEDAQGEPFVGQAGKLLDNMLAAIKLKRGSNVYIANIVKCRPPKNRTPEADEIATCMPYLQQQITLIKPKLIVALGKTAATALLGKDATLGSLRGKVHEYQGTPLIVTYHPAYLLRSPAEKAKAWEDLCLAVSQS
jgi:DNA polymerase